MPSRCAPRPRGPRLVLALAAFGLAANAANAGNAANAANASGDEAGRLEVLQRAVDLQGTRLDALRQAMADEIARFEALRRSLAEARGQTLPQPVPGERAAVSAATSAAIDRPAVGQAPEGDGRMPAVAPIFEQPGVLTPAGHGVLEPSLQYAYSSSNRIALVGYTVIPAILVGLVDVREVKRNTFNATLAGRWGLTNRLELEARVPYSYRADTSIGREMLQGRSADAAFSASGHGLGDVELTGRYQFNDTNPATAANAGAAIWVGSLRFKSRTGRDPFQVETDNSITGLRDGVQTTLPTGSGFYGLQPALTALFPSDPAVFFGTVSYLHNLERRNVVRRTGAGPEPLGTVAAGDVIGFNFGMGLGLNEKSSFSLGYDHASVGRTKVNGQALADSVRVQLGTLLLGYSYRLSADRSLAVSLGAGITRDTPDVTLTVRMPVTF